MKASTSCNSYPCTLECPSAQIPTNSPEKVPCANGNRSTLTRPSPWKWFHPGKTRESLLLLYLLEARPSRIPRTLNPTPCTPYCTPYTLHLTPYTPHPAGPELSCVAWKPAPHDYLHLTPYAQHPSPHTSHPTPYTIFHTPFTLHPICTPCTLHPGPRCARIALRPASRRLPQTPKSNTLTKAFHKLHTTFSGRILLEVAPITGGVGPSQALRWGVPGIALEKIDRCWSRLSTFGPGRLEFLGNGLLKYPLEGACVEPEVEGCRGMG